MAAKTTKEKEIRFHLLFWLAIWLFGCFQNLWTDYSLVDIFGHTTLMLIPQVIAGYTLVFWQLPQLVYKKRYILAGLSLLVTAYVFAIMARIMVIYIVEELYREPPFYQESLPEILTDLSHLFRGYVFKVYSYAFAFLGAVLIKERFADQRKQQTLIQEKITAELNFLKAQVHPHFLFNTLNNLYVLTLQKSDQAPETVLKLSKMLDYMLYQCNGERVPLAKEIELIQNYIALEKLRYGTRLDLSFEQTVDHNQQAIAPLLMVPLIENAFKHGASGNVDRAWIKIVLRLHQGQLHFEVSNSRAGTKQQDKTAYTKGIGLGNMENQLQLIYPNKHQLMINETTTDFNVILKIDLSADESFLFDHR